MGFDKLKKIALERLEHAVKTGEVDRPALSLLRKINAQKDLFTSSSCWGRVMLIDFSGEKEENKFRGKWHRTVTYGEVKKALERANGKQIWLRVEPLILHISCRDLKTAKTVLDIKNKAGIKRGGIFHMGRDRIQIELEGTQRLESLVKLGTDVLVDGRTLRKLVKIADTRIKRNEQDWKKLEKLFGVVSK
jgi:tRNA wybutosine-synthesizing protein 3